MCPVFAVATLLLTLLSGSPIFAQDVRIRLLDLSEPGSIALSAHEGPVRLYAGDYADPVTEIEAGQTARVSRAGEQLHVFVDELALYAASLRVEPAEGAFFGVQVDGATGEDRRYAGRLFVSTDGSDPALQLVNEVPLEDYVASVVASEYGFDDLEGSKAMAVIVRTYTLGVLGRYGSAYDHVDHTLSQVYRGAGAVTPVSSSAARLTEGDVLTYGGELIRAVYFASSGGHTADNETVWDGPSQPYLRGKPDPYGADAPHAHWSTRLSRDGLLSELRTAYGQDVEGFVVGDRSDDGRVATIELMLAGGGRLPISGNDFRLLVTRHFGARSVRSTLFEARRAGDEYVFEGRGFGHGVGLSQWGAREMALRGSAYTEILGFYYSDVVLSSLEDLREEAPQVAREEMDANPEDPQIARDESQAVREAPETGRDETDVPARVVRVPEEPDTAPGERRRIGW